jgi:ABC-2 type transport system ATP-binding protein
MSALIAVHGLTKGYGRSRGIIDVTFEIAEGEVFGFLGPNGAGKTTTMRVLMGFLRPTMGQARIGGLDCWRQSTQVKRLVSYLPGEFSCDPELTGAQIIAYLGHLRGSVDQGYVRQLVERLGLDPSKRFREYSRGNKQKVGLVQAFMHRPRLLVLDEPTSGLDPLNQQEFYTLLSEAHADGRTIFLSSHNLPEVEHTCERVGIIREGKLVTVDEVATLKHLKQHDVDLSFAAPASLEWFSHLPGLLSAAPGRSSCEVHLALQGDLHDVIKVAAEHDAASMVTHEPSLEEVFLRFYEPERSLAVVNR